jgi:hypothetical protein
MRSTARNESGSARGAVLGLSLLAGLVALAGAGDALAQSMTNMGGSGYRTRGAAEGLRSNAARPMPVMGYGYRAGPRVKGYAYAPRLKGRAYRPARRAKRYYYRGVAPTTCGLYKYWSRAKGRCLDARTSPPALK